MFRLAIIDAKGKILNAKDLPTAAELLLVVEQARSIIRDCERLAQGANTPNASSGGKTVPYLS